MLTATKQSTRKSKAMRKEEIEHFRCEVRQFLNHLEIRGIQKKRRTNSS